mgnify:FL=1
MTVTTVEHVYTPRGAALELFQARDSEVLLSGPAGTGKSLACLEKLHLMALLNPGLRGAIIRKTQTSLGSTALKTWREFVAKEAIANGTVKFYGGSAAQPPQYRYNNGSTILIVGMDKPSRIMSSELDIAYVQEATELTVEDWEAITTRLRNNKIPSGLHQLIADCNPDTPTHWLLARCQAGTTRMLESRHEDNPVLFDDAGQVTERGKAYLSVLDALTGVRYQRLRLGLWVAAEGIIYEDFDPAVHVVNPFPIPQDWARYWSIDFGFTNPFVLQCWAEDPDGRLFLYREIYRTGRTVDQHARDILKVVTGRDGAWTEPRSQAIIADHDAENRRRFETEIGQGTRAADKKVLNGIQIVQARMRPAEDGKPRIFFFRDAVVERDPDLVARRLPTCTVEEIPGYVWLPDGSGRVTSKEQPLKKDDHGCLVAGTMVETPDGPVPIEALRHGDYVETRSGPSVVVDARMTQSHARVLTVNLSNGGTLIGTADHPVWVDRGAAGEWTRLDALRYADRLWAWEKQSSSTGLPSADTQTHPTSPIGTTTPPGSQTSNEASSYSTSRYGRPTTGPSPMAARSITPTSTHSTTTLTTSSVSRSPSTRKPTGNRAVLVVGLLSAWSTWIGYVRSLSRGMVRMRGVSGIASTPQRWGSVLGASVQQSATNAEPTSSTPALPGTAGSARTTARALSAGLAVSTTSPGSAPDAGQSSWSTSTPCRSTVDVSVLSVLDTGRRSDVYNLTIEDVPEYFANGVLVHNCDAMRYLAVEQDPGARPRVRVMR